jgi:hypothetical protein
MNSITLWEGEKANARFAIFGSAYAGQYFIILDADDTYFDQLQRIKDTIRHGRRIAIAENATILDRMTGRYSADEVAEFLKEAEKIV